MTERIENRMVVDAEWDELEYGLKAPKTREQRQRQAYKEMEEKEKHERF